MRAFPSHEFAIGRTWPFLFLEDPRACGHVPINDAGPQAGPADDLANLARLSHRCHGLQDPGVAAAELAGLHSRTRSRGRCGIRCAWPALSGSTRVNNGWSMCSRMECAWPGFEQSDVRRRLVWTKIGRFKAQTCVWEALTT